VARGRRRRLPRQCPAGRDRTRRCDGGPVTRESGVRSRPLIVNARFPWVLFLPLASITELGGVILILSGRGIGWAAIAAPLIGFFTMRGPVRPRFEFTNAGVTFRKSSNSSILPWVEIARLASAKGGVRPAPVYRP